MPRAPQKTGRADGHSPVASNMNMMASAASSIAKQPFFCSWSGGKDSCLALYHALREGGKPKRLLTMLSDDGHGSRSHGLPRSLLEEQARQTGIPVVFRSASWAGYEAAFSAALEAFRGEGITDGVFGDIDLPEHRDWCVRVCGAQGIRARHPLWSLPRRELLEEFIGLGFQATVIVVKAEILGPDWLGRSIDERAISEMERLGIDPSGEAGEYHTVVTDGPLFCKPLRLSYQPPVIHGGHWFLRVTHERDPGDPSGEPREPTSDG
jgi:diphthine-ammonia ligase